MKPIPFAEINRELVPKDPLEQAQFGAALFERCRQHHNTEPTTPEGKQRRKTLWLPRIRAAASMVAEARMLLPEVQEEFAVRFDRRVFVRNRNGKNLMKLIDINRTFQDKPSPIKSDFDPLEDFTTYSVLDPNSRFTITQTQITATGLSLGEDAWVYKDFGTGHFGTFTHLFETHCTNSTNWSYCTAWAISNTVDDGVAWYHNHAQALGCFWYYNTTAGTRLYLRDYEDAGGDQDYCNVSLNTTYYLTAERSGTSGLLHIYTDSSRSTLLDTLAVMLDASRTYRYLFTVHTHNASDTSRTISVIFANLDLQETVPVFRAVWAEGINTHHF